MKRIRIGTRGSKLALWQANAVAGLLNKGGIDTSIHIIETKGDKILDVSIGKIGAKGVFTEEIEEQLKLFTIDIAVHSAKDMQSELPESMELIAFPARERSNDVLVSDNKNMSLLRSGGQWVIGTSSTRRAALLKHHFPGIKTIAVRGNLQTRIRKMREGQCDALLLAYAGIHRLGYDNLIVEHMPLDIFVPPAGQGAIAVEASVNLPNDVLQVVRTLINDELTETCVLAERAFMKTLQGGCSIPVFVSARIDGALLHISGGVVSLDGRKLVSKTISGDPAHPKMLGAELGQHVLEQGGREILENIRAKG